MACQPGDIEPAWNLFLSFIVLFMKDAGALCPAIKE